MLVRRRVFEEVGRMGESTFHGNEDWDLCWRAARAGWKTVFYHEVSVVHVGHGASDQFVAYPETEHFAYHNLYVVLSDHHPAFVVKINQAVRYLMYVLEVVWLRLFSSEDGGSPEGSPLSRARYRRNLVRDFLLGRIQPIRRYGEDRLASPK